MMQPSKNTLVIESIEVQHDFEEFIMEATLNLVIKFDCTVTGKPMQEFIFQTRNRGYTDRDCIRDAIQDFLDGRFYYNERRIHNVDSESIASTKIHKLDIQIPEPYKSLFEDLFKPMDFVNPVNLIA